VPLWPVCVDYQQQTIPSCGSFQPQFRSAACCLPVSAQRQRRFSGPMLPLCSALSHALAQLLSRSRRLFEVKCQDVAV
jgi:hypothetical protein